jgi:hypothetical protein
MRRESPTMDPMNEKKKRGPKEVTPEHKAAMATGRREAKAVGDYLEALESNKPKRGRRRTTESITNRLAAIETEIVSADPLNRVNLIQERMDLNAELSNTAAAVDLSGLEAQFVGSAKSYSERRGISYAAWRELGVDPAVLKKAGVSR